MQVNTSQGLSVMTSNHNIGGLQQSVFGDLYVRYRLEKSFNGYDPSVLKSGFQKYARRAVVEKGLWCLVEMDLFSLLEWNGAALNAYLEEYTDETFVNTKRQAQRLRTNMVNRLVVMMSEEVNISAWWMPEKIADLYKKWTESRDNPLSRKYLVDMYLYLTSQKMIRLISDLHSVYLVPPDYVKPKHMNNLKEIHYNIQKRYPAIYADQTNVGHVSWTVNIGSYPTKLQPCVDGIIYNLEKCSDHVFYWIKKLCEIEKQDGVPQYKYLKIVWEILHGFIDRNSEYEFVRDQVRALQEFYKRMTHKEKPIYLYHAVLLIVRRNEIDWNSRPPQIDTTTKDVDKIYSDHVNGGKMAIDDYVLDLHTQRGKKIGNCLENFALEGAFVTNENDSFLHPEYREIYILLKKELDRYNNGRGEMIMNTNVFERVAGHVGVPIRRLSAETMAIINDAPQGQNRTSNYKKAVKIFEDLVFKGPFTCDDKKLMNNLKYTYALEVLEDVLQLPEWQRSSLRWEYVGCWNDNQFYLVGTNVGKRNGIPFDIVSTKIEKDVKVVPRGEHVCRVSDIEGTALLTDTIKLASLQHLYLRFLLDLGDSGTHNILVRNDSGTAERVIAGIDLEEKRGIKVNDSQLDHLFKKVASSKQHGLYQSDVCKIKTLSGSQLDQQALERLDSVGIDLERLKENVGLWESLK